MVKCDGCGLSKHAKAMPPWSMLEYHSRYDYCQACTTELLNFMNIGSTQRLAMLQNEGIEL